MTASALWFFDDDVVEELGDDNESTDSGSKQLQSRYHVDNCRIEEGFATIADHYRLALENFNPAASNLAEARRHFGHVLHTTQDFYAHSNWVESGQTGIFDEDHFAVPSPVPGGRLGPLVVLTNDWPDDWTVQRGSDSRVPRVFDGSTWIPALITGTYPENDDSSICHEEGSIWHGPFLYYDPGLFFQPYDYASFLAKDAPESPHHEEALALAKEQTVEEACRLDRLLRLRYGQAGHDLFMREWIEDATGFSAECAANESLVAGLMLVAL